MMIAQSLRSQLIKGITQASYYHEAFSLLTRKIHVGKELSLPMGIDGIEEYLDVDNDRPYTFRKGKKPLNPDKHLSFRRRSHAYMQPFSLDVNISKRYVRAAIVHRATSKIVAVAGTNSRDIKAIVAARCDIPACLAVGRILADRAKESDVFTATYSPRPRERFEGKLRAVVQSLIDNGIDVKVYLH